MKVEKRGKSKWSDCGREDHGWGPTLSYYYNTLPSIKGYKRANWEKKKGKNRYQQGEGKKRSLEGGCKLG